MAQLGDTIIKGDLNVTGSINGNHNIINITDFNTFDPKTLNMKAGDLISFNSSNYDSNNYVLSNCSVAGIILRPRDDANIFWLVGFSTESSTSSSAGIYVRKYLSSNTWGSWFKIGTTQV